MCGAGAEPCDREHSEIIQHERQYQILPRFLYEYITNNFIRCHYSHNHSTYYFNPLTKKWHFMCMKFLLCLCFTTVTRHSTSPFYNNFIKLFLFTRSNHCVWLRGVGGSKWPWSSHTNTSCCPSTDRSQDLMMWREKAERTERWKGERTERSSFVGNYWKFDISEEDGG